MVLCKLGILIGCTVDLPKDKLQKRKKPKKEKNKKQKASKSTKSAKEKDVNIIISEKPKYEYNLDKPNAIFQIEYKLLSKLPNYTIDVLFWKEISKIVTKDGTVVYRNYITDKLVWVPVMIEHDFDQLTNEEILILQSSLISITIKENKKGTGLIKVDNCNIFYIRQADIDVVGFLEAYEYDPNARNSGDNKKDEKILQSTNAESDSFKSKLLQFEKHMLFPNMVKIIQRFEEKYSVCCKPFVLPPSLMEEAIIEDFDGNPDLIKWPMAKNKKKSKNAKKKSKGEKKTKKTKKTNTRANTECNIKICGESFFTDPTLSIYEWESENAKIHKAYALLSVNNVLTKEQKVKMNPLVIKTKTLKNLPVDCLKEHNFQSVYLQYVIPNYVKCVTLPKPLSKKIHFNEAHAYFNVPKGKIVEFLQSKTFRVELIGIKDKTNAQAAIFGTEINDYLKEKLNNYTQEETNEIVLAVAAYDLSLLLEPVVDLQLNNPFRHPSHLYSQPNNAMYENLKFNDTVTINAIHQRIKPKPLFESPLMDEMLIRLGTSLEVQTYMTAPLKYINYVFKNNRMHRRMLLIVYDVELIQIILNEVMEYNEAYMPNSFLPNYFLLDKLEHKNLDTHNRMVTGFFLDNGNSFLVCIEGLADNYCLELIWSQIEIFNDTVCKIFYNSYFVFEDRLYDYFLPLGGFYKITLKFQFQHIFKIIKVYDEKSLPQLCYQAIKKFELLLRTSTIREIHQYGLFPTARELLSFGMEFGVPHKILY